MPLVASDCQDQSPVVASSHPLQSELNFPIGAKDDLDFTDEGERWALPIAVIDIVLFASKRALRASGLPRESAAWRAAMRVEEAEMPVRMQLARTTKGSIALMERFIKMLVKGFDERALQREPHMVLLREEFYEELKELLAKWLLCYLRSQDVATPKLSGSVRVHSQV